MTAAIGVAIGDTVGDSAFNAQLAGVVGQNAVENNKTSYWQDIKHLGFWSDECVVAYKQMDAAQDAAFRKCRDITKSNKLKLILHKLIELVL